jgi:2-aminobenzoate-CoA ligase
MKTAHLDTFVHDNLPPIELQPDFIFELPELEFPDKMNCAVEILDMAISKGYGDRICIQCDRLTWTYKDLLDRANQMANVLIKELQLKPGNRVLLRSANTPEMVASWFAVVKAGGIAVATMPLLRSLELIQIIDKAQVSHAICDHSLRDELLKAQEGCQSKSLKQVSLLRSAESQLNGVISLDISALSHSTRFENFSSLSTDCCILAFTSGTTGVPKATIHTHRDVMSICTCWPKFVLKPEPTDVFIGSPPIAFTFGLGGLILFPMTFGASVALLEKASPKDLLIGIQKFKATVLFTAPTSYRQLALEGLIDKHSSLRKCVSAGEALPGPTRALWKQATGIEIIDGIGTTEMLHIFISANELEAIQGATGRVVKGYKACILDDNGNQLPAGEIGHLAVKGPTGCRYLNDERQAKYIKNGWNVTGDAYLMDENGYFHYQSRTDDMIISSGYNIAGPEIETCILSHPSVTECAVVGEPDDARGAIVKAFVVLKANISPNDSTTKSIQDHVKAQLAPYKYPRKIEYVESLPKTETGKIQRFKLRQ